MPADGHVLGDGQVRKDCAHARKGRTRSGGVSPRSRVGSLCTHARASKLTEASPVLLHLCLPLLLDLDFAFPFALCLSPRPARLAFGGQIGEFGLVPVDVAAEERVQFGQGERGRIGREAVDKVQVPVDCKEEVQLVGSPSHSRPSSRSGGQLAQERTSRARICQLTAVDFVRSPDLCFTFELCGAEDDALELLGAARVGVDLTRSDLCLFRLERFQRLDAVVRHGFAWLSASVLSENDESDSREAVQLGPSAREGVNRAALYEWLEGHLARITICDELLRFSGTEKMRGSDSSEKSLRLRGSCGVCARSQYR